MQINDITQLINKIEEDFTFEGGSIDFISEFRTRVTELQEVHYSEDGHTTFCRTPSIIGSAGGFSVMPMANIAQLAQMMGMDGSTDPDEVAGPQTETCFNKLHEWLKDEGRA